MSRVLNLNTDHASYSSLSLICPYAAFLRYNGKIEGPSTPWLVLGTSLHTAIEKTHNAGVPFNLLTAVGIFKSEYRGDLEKKEVFIGYPLLKKLEGEGVEMLELYDEQIRRGKIKEHPLALEKEFEIDFEGDKLVGKIDRIDYDETDGEYTVSDLKSGKAKLDDFTLRHNYQFTMYAWGIRELYGRLPKKLYWHHLRTGEQFETIRTEDDINDLKEVIRNSRKMKSLGMRHRVYNKDICGMCNYKGATCEDRALEKEIVSRLANA